MSPSRKQPRQPPIDGNGIGWMPIVIVALLLVVGVLVYVYWQRERGRGAAGPAGPAPATQSAEVISNNRMIYGGIPRPRNGTVNVEILSNKAYMVGYSEERRDPLWVAYRVFHNPHPYDLPRPRGGFLSDSRSTAHVRDADFARSGFDRGHMAPNSAIARCYGAEAQLETFLLTNICPQSPALNEKVWERLEVAERRYADELEEVWVMDGPIFGDLTGGKTSRLPSGIAVPEAFYKILVDEEGRPGGKPRVFAVIMPQDVKGTELPQQYATSVSEIEKETGLEFFWKLDDATRRELEAKASPMW
jgi:endonuclease G